MTANAESSATADRGTRKPKAKRVSFKEEEKREGASESPIRLRVDWPQRHCQALRGRPGPSDRGPCRKSGTPSAYGPGSARRQEGREKDPQQVRDQVFFDVEC